MIALSIEQVMNCASLLNIVPEKIYAYIPKDDIAGTASIQKGFPHQFVTEEYTRTDAFIEKALKFLDGNFFFNNIRHSIESGVFDSMEEMYKDFKKYMES